MVVAAGVGMWMSALNVKYRDIRYARRERSRLRSWSLRRYAFPRLEREFAKVI
jgi:hypothetical protein